MAPTRHELDRAWELATSVTRDVPEWRPESQPLDIYAPGGSDAWACGTRRQIFWRLHLPGRDRRPVSLKLVTADQWRGAVSQLAAEVDPGHGCATVTVPHVPRGTYWIQISRGSRLLATSHPFVIGPASGHRPTYGYRRARPAPPRASGYPG
ncbi:hypothetical protein ACFYNY_36170 [Streptomyces sp. NPDC006530]|uniref:hypothetical protein n=1 Tax=Streptomyces sp. NPDC006530 TaxID=3364750 RepID=UPI0036831FDA